MNIEKKLNNEIPKVYFINKEQLLKSTALVFTLSGYDIFLRTPSMPKYKSSDFTSIRKIQLTINDNEFIYKTKSNNKKEELLLLEFLTLESIDYYEEQLNRFTFN